MKRFLVELPGRREGKREEEDLLTYFLSKVIERVVLLEVDHIQSIDHPWPQVRKGEVEPLRMTPCVDIRAQNQIVLVGTRLDGAAEVPRFETRFEEEGGVGGARRDVPGKSG